MPRRLGLAAAMLATGIFLIGTAQLAGAAPERRGGIFKVGTNGAAVVIDPQVAYINTSWWMQYATAVKLYNFTPGGKLVPEVASSVRVSGKGKRYTFTLRKGFRFSDGSAVTPRNFKYAIDRSANRDLAAPAAQFITDPHGSEIVGAKRVNEGQAQSVSGVQVKGNKLIINLIKADPAFIGKLTMPFFQATSTRLPLDREVDTVRGEFDLPSAGPYAFTRNDVNRVTQLRRNPYWKPGQGRTARPNLDGVDVLWNLDEQAAFEMVERGELDQGPVPAGEMEGVVSRYGLNKTRFWVTPSLCGDAILLNSRNSLFRGNPALRKAVSWALDRTDYTSQAAPYSSTPWTHILPPAVLGSITKPSLQPYSTRANLEKARRLAAGHFRDGRITVYYRDSSTVPLAQAEVVRRDLVNLGFEPANITMRGFSGAEWYTAITRSGSDADLAVSVGYCHDYADPVGWFIPLGVDVWFPGGSTYRDKIARAKRSDLGKLDLEIMRNLAPFAVMNAYNDRSFFSDRVDPRSLRYHKAYSGWSIPSLALK